MAIDVKTRPWPVRLRYRIEAVAAYLLFALMAALPIDAASALGGWLGRTIGPRLAACKKARRNLARAMPELSETARERIVVGMWDNLGRVVAEYPHIVAIGRDPARAELVGAEHLERLAGDGKPGFLVGGHLANWEMAPVAVAHNGLPLAVVYRPPNNPAVDRLIRFARRDISTGLLPKSAEGARALIRLMTAGGHAGLLVDQKMNDGIPVPFFGRDAMTAPAIASLALKYDAPIVPARVERLGGAHFRVTLYPPLELPRTGDRNADIRAVMTRINALLEDWVRQRPEQWLWLHRRWPD